MTDWTLTVDRQGERGVWTNTNTKEREEEESRVETNVLGIHCMHCVGVLILGWVGVRRADTILIPAIALLDGLTDGLLGRMDGWTDGIIGVHLDVGWN